MADGRMAGKQFEQACLGRRAMAEITTNRVGDCGLVIQEQAVEGMSIALTTAAAPEMNATQELIVTLTDALGAPVDGADVYLDLTMPAMPMGTNRPIASPGANGAYRVQTAFTMTGDWSVTVVADVGGQERRATFTVAVSEQ